MTGLVSSRPARRTFMSGFTRGYLPCSGSRLHVSSYGLIIRATTQQNPPQHLRLDRLRRRVAGAGYVIRDIREGFACFISKFLIRGADPSNRVFRAVIPGDLRLAVHINPLAMHVAQGPHGVAVLIESDVKGIPVAFANLPLADEVAARRPGRIGGG